MVAIANIVFSLMQKKHRNIIQPASIHNEPWQFFSKFKLKTLKYTEAEYFKDQFKTFYSFVLNLIKVNI